MIFNISLIVITSLVLLFIATILFLRQKQQKIDILSKELDNLKIKYNNEQIKTKTLETEIKYLTINKNELESNIKTITYEVLKNSNKILKDENKQTLQEVLTPIQYQLDQFKKKVDEVYHKESQDRNELKLELKLLKSLNEKISQDALNLTNALKGEVKTQGIWGEMILEKVLENSGLREGYEYFREQNFQNDEGKNFRPDVIVNLPQEKQVIIDAKTSLISYERYISCNKQDEKEIFLKQYLKSIYNHIDTLTNKNYEKLQGINTLDFIFMFIPIESALMLAMQEDKNLFDMAFKKKIVLVSPTTLLIALKSIENNWRYEKQAQNISEVIRLSEKLYKKVVMFVEDFEKVGKSLNLAQKSYDEAFKKLSNGRDNIIRQLEVFKTKANITPSKSLDKQLIENSL